MMRKILFLSVLLGFCVTQGEAGTFNREAVTVRRLDNGLKILLCEDHDIPNIAYYTFFRVGSRNERVGLTGVSHFIEHMMFNGTEAFGPGEFDRIMEQSGGANNAYTSDDLTAYTDWFPTPAMGSMMEMESNRMQGLLFKPDVLESERGVIASERRLSVENNNENLLDETVRATAILAHSYHWSVIGWMSDILGWKRDEIMDYYQTYYSPNNAVLVVVGDFSTPDLMARIETMYGKILRGPEPPALITTEPPQLGPRRVVIRKDVQVPSFLMVYRAPACTDPDFPAMRVLDIVLLQGESSRLYRKLVADLELCLSVYGGIGETVDPLLFAFNPKPRPGADLERIEKEIETELDRVVREGITQREFEKAMNTIRTDFYGPLQSIAGKANALGQTEVLYGGYENLFVMMDRYKALDLEKIRQAAAKYLVENNKTVGMVLPQGGGHEE